MQRILLLVERSILNIFHDLIFEVSLLLMTLIALSRSNWFLLTNIYPRSNFTFLINFYDRYLGMFDTECINYHQVRLIML